MTSMGPSPAAVERVHYATTDVDEGTETICRIYSDHVPAFSGRQEDYELELTSAAVESGGVRWPV